jgi:tetratricopeptide (TPR) repeat protein
MGFDAYNLLGLLYQYLGDEDKALELFKKSTQVFHNNGASFVNCALIYEKRKESDKALDYYKKAYAINKSDAYAKRKMLMLQGNTLPVMVGPLFRLSLVVFGIVDVIYLLAK